MDKVNKSLLIMGGVLIFLLIVIIVIMRSGGITGNPVKEGKESCPTECCIEGKYYEKRCSQNYECINNYCVAIDSDGDGLTNIEEQSLGTNPQLYDTDGDTLSDYQESKNLGTNPLKKNTDGDRYDDNEDQEPLVVNSAYIVFDLLNEEGKYHYLTLIADSVIIGGATAALGICTSGTLGACATAIPSVWNILSPILEDTIYTKTFDVMITNQGDDYTSYLDYDISYYIGSEKLKTTAHTEGMLKAHGNLNVHYSEEIKIKDIQYGITWDLIFGKEKITIQVENLDYESFR